MRRLVPRRGGSSRTGRSALSAWPSFRAGAFFVSHTSVSARPGIEAISLTFGARPSMRNTDFPSASWPVTTRRTLQIIFSSGRAIGRAVEYRKTRRKFDRRRTDEARDVPRPPRQRARRRADRRRNARPRPASRAPRALRAKLTEPRERARDHRGRRRSARARALAGRAAASAATGGAAARGSEAACADSAAAADARLPLL